MRTLPVLCLSAVWAIFSGKWNIVYVISSSLSLSLLSLFVKTIWHLFYQSLPSLSRASSAFGQVSNLPSNSFHIFINYTNFLFLEFKICISFRLSPFLFLFSRRVCSFCLALPRQFRRRACCFSMPLPYLFRIRTCSVSLWFQCLFSRRVFSVCLSLKGKGVP